MAKKVASKQPQAHLDDAHPVNQSIKHVHNKQILIAVAKIVLVDLTLILAGVLIYALNKSAVKDQINNTELVTLGVFVALVGLTGLATSILFIFIVGGIALYKKHVLKLANTKAASQAVNNGLSAASAI
ncbi:MAG: hypothetical protein LBQ45_00455 [Mycoplasmataceae bacterium]|nr:hypothetical protein [Mycoplasmataceae bacterium]